MRHNKLLPHLNVSAHGYAQSVVRRLIRNNRTELEQEISLRSDEVLVRKEINKLLRLG